MKHGSSKMLDKHIRTAMREKTSPRIRFVALMTPMVIVPDNPEHSPVIAEAGSIVELLNQRTLYRDRVSPITRRADELLVQYGSAGKTNVGWLTNKQPPKSLRPSEGPVFLVKTSSESTLIAWELFRLKVARTRKTDPTNWIAPWLATHGSKHPQQLREVTRFFGGTPIKNEGSDARCTRLFTLILNTELDMATAKSSKVSKKNKSGKKVKVSSSEKAERGTKKKIKVKPEREALDKSTLITRKFNEHVIKRLVKENPLREGTARAKIWTKLKSGMTVEQFVEACKGAYEGRGRTELRHYVESGWVKLRRPGA